MTITTGTTTHTHPDTGSGVGAFPEPPRREQHPHNPMSELFSYDAFSARAQAIKELLNGVYTFDEAREEARRCADEANIIAERNQWPTVDADETIPPSQILGVLPAPPNGEPSATAGGEVPVIAGEITHGEVKRGKHRRDDEDAPPTPDPDPVSAGAPPTGPLHAPRSMGDTQLIQAVSPLAG